MVSTTPSGSTSNKSRPTSCFRASSWCPEWWRWWVCHAVSSRKRGMAPLGERVDGMKRWILFGSFLVLVLWLLAWIWFLPVTPMLSAVLTVGSQTDRASEETGPPNVSPRYFKVDLDWNHLRSV